MKNSLLILFILSNVLTSCQKKTCEGLLFKNGITTENGKRYSGQCVVHHTNGNLSSVKSYENGYDHGEWKFFFPNGSLKLKGNFIYGKKDGEWTYYFENGNIWKKQFFKSGAQSGVWLTYNENCEIINKEEIIN